MRASCYKIWERTAIADRSFKTDAVPVAYALHLFSRPVLTVVCTIQREPIMQILKLLPFAIVAGCTSGAPQNSGPPTGSQAWFETASTQETTNYFRGQCVASGYMPGTAEMAQCIEREADAHNQTNVARRAAVAGATAGN